MFQPAERTILMNEADPTVLVKIATELNKDAESYNVDEVAKN